MASVADIAPLGTPTTKVGDADVKKEITRLANTIIKSSTDGLKSATQTVVGNVPQMIADLTKQIESGPVDNFAIAMNKLVKLVDKLGINLKDYNKKLGKMVDKARGTQEKLQQELHELREKGFRVEIDEKTNTIKWLTEKDTQIREQQIIDNEKQIKHLEEVRRIELENQMEEKLAKGEDTTELQAQRIKNEDDIQELREKNEDKKLAAKGGKRVDTGFSGNDQGFGKIAELKEAFMIVPDTIAEVFGGFKNIGKVLTKSFAGFFAAPMKTIKKVFGAIANVFKIARVAIALKVMGVIMVLQWIAEKLGAIGGVFKKIWAAITGFFKKIGDWFKNSWLGKKLGLGGDDEGEEEEKSGGVLTSEGTGKYSQMDDGTYEVGNVEPGTNKKDMVAESESKWYKPWTWGKDKKENEQITPIIPKDVETEFASADGSTDGKSWLTKKSVVGQTADGEHTPQKLEDLQKELKAYEERNVIQVNNNSQVNSNSSNGTTVSGFVDHEPDTSFKYIRNNNSDSNWI